MPADMVVTRKISRDELPGLSASKTIRFSRTEYANLDFLHFRLLRQNFGHLIQAEWGNIVSFCAPTEKPESLAISQQRQKA